MELSARELVSPAPKTAQHKGKRKKLQTKKEGELEHLRN
jgi:hypothetical protein